MPDFTRVARSSRHSAASVVCSYVVACGGGSGGGTVGGPVAGSAMSPLAQLGEKIFHDPSLSASGTMSCATCHDPDHALASAVNEPVPSGGAGLDVPGFRNAPSLRYIAKTPTFGFDDGAPLGGFDRDGRAVSLIEQARRPFLAAHEMANAAAADVSDKLSQATYATDFKAVFGNDVFDQPEVAFDRALTAIARYETEDPDFAPFTSKYDYFLAGKTQLTRGRATRARAVQRSAEGQLRRLSSERARRRTANRRCSPTSATTTSACRATQRFPPTTIRPISISGCAGRSATISPPHAICAARSRCRRCATSRVPRRTFHNGRFATLRKRWRSTCAAIRIPRSGIPSTPTERSTSSTTCRRSTSRTSTSPKCHTTGRSATSPALTPAEIDDVVAFLQTLTDGFQP